MNDSKVFDATHRLKQDITAEFTSMRQDMKATMTNLKSDLNNIEANLTAADNKIKDRLTNLEYDDEIGSTGCQSRK